MPASVSFGSLPSWFYPVPFWAVWPNDMKRPTNGELDVMVEGLKEHFSSKIDSAFVNLNNSIDRVEEQTIKTNGRVTRLERWMYVCIGGGFVVTAFVIPLMVYVWNTTQSLDERIDKGISRALSQYEVQIEK